MRIFALVLGPSLALGLAMHATVVAADGTADTTEPASEAIAEGAAVAEPVGEAMAEAAAATEPAGEAMAGAAAAPEQATASAEAAEVAAEAAPASMGTADAAPAPSQPSQPAAAPALGPVGYDARGRPGRIHVVVSGDTLWDISDAYLGTPWVWPSIWKDNPDVANPHRIYPNDRIWITPTEMRRVSAAEAARMLAARPPADEAPPAAFEDAAPEPATAPSPRIFRLSSIDSLGLVSREVLEAAASLVESSESRVWLAQGDSVYVGLGEGEVEVGDQFTIVRASEAVIDPETGDELGVFVDVRGWLQVSEVHPESATATIRSSVAEARRGDLLLPRQERASELAVQSAAAPVQGRVAFLPDSRKTMGSADVVYLNRGEDHGLAAGVPLEVYRAGDVADEAVRSITVQLPDFVIAKLLVVSAQPETAVAVVTQARSEIATGDLFRTAPAEQP